MSASRISIRPFTDEQKAALGAGLAQLNTDMAATREAMRASVAGIDQTQAFRGLLHWQESMLANLASIDWTPANAAFRKLAQGFRGGSTP